MARGCPHPSPRVASTQAAQDSGGTTRPTVAAIRPTLGEGFRHHAGRPPAASSRAAGSSAVWDEGPVKSFYDFNVTDGNPLRVQIPASPALTPLVWPPRVPCTRTSQGCLTECLWDPPLFPATVFLFN